MWSWKLRELSLFGFFVLSLSHCPLAFADTPLSVTLTGITSYNDAQEIRAALTQSAEMKKVVIESEAPGLILLKADYPGDASLLINNLTTIFPQKYIISQKQLPNGSTEITFSRR